MYQNSIYGMFNQSYVQEQQRQCAQWYHETQMRKSFDCARKFEDVLKSVDELAPEYKQLACRECCAVAGKYLRAHGMF